MTYNNKNDQSSSFDNMHHSLSAMQNYQVELEMQNDELRRAHAELEIMRASYEGLYDLAPVGYCTVSKEGLLLQANLTVATQLGTQRQLLVNQRISKFIFPDDQDIYYKFHKKLFELGKAQACELRMLRQDGSQFWANMASAVTIDADGVHAIRIILSDVGERKQLEAALVSVADACQQSIGQELHDNLGQQIAAIGYQANVLEKLISPSGNEDASKIVASIATQAQSAVMQIKHVAQSLLPFEVTEKGLVAALQALASRISATYWISCDFLCREQVVINDIDLAFNLYRIAQEAAHNAIRHGRAQHITISLDSENDNIFLSICDDGSGFNCENTKREATSGVGIKIMKHRTEQFGASLEILSRAEGGIEVRVLKPGRNR